MIDIYAKHHLLGRTTGEGTLEPKIELILIQGGERNRSAYLLFDGQYGRSVRAGEKIREWTVAKIYADAIELKNNDISKTLMLGTDLGPHEHIEGQR